MLFIIASSLHAQENDPKGVDTSQLSDEEIQQVKATERFMIVLEKNPRRGTALDRVYGHHIEFGSLDTFIKKLKARVENSPSDDSVWMLIGLFESQRGNDAAAVDAFTKADTLRTSDAMASYYLGQAQLRIGQTDESIASLERALTKNPTRADLLEIYQQLGRIHQRAQRTEAALDVWKRLEKPFGSIPTNRN